MANLTRDNDAVDLRDIGAALSRGKAWVAGGAVAGLLAGMLATTLLSPRYEGQATIVLRGGEASGSLGGLASALPIGLGGTSVFDTELAILSSRQVLGEVVDSLRMQATVLEPESTPLGAIFADVRLPAQVEKPMTFRFEKSGGAFRVEGPGATGEARPGVPFALAGGSVTLRADSLPDRFEVSVVSRQDAIQAASRELTAKPGVGDVAVLEFEAGDPQTAAAVPNAMIARYMERRRTTDRGTNQHRYEFLTAHADSISRALAISEGRLRAYQEESGTMDPALSGQSDLGQAARLRAELEELDAEARALGEIANGRVPSTRDLAAYPTLLRNGAMNNLLSRMLDLESQRTALLNRRTPEDPDVVVLSTQIKQLEGELVGLSRSYVQGTERKRNELRQELSRYEGTLAALPARSEQILRLQREVRRLSETLVALQTQLVQTRLAAIGEGGDVRPLDLAVVPRNPSFPIPLLNLLGGLLGGLFFGAVGAVAAARARPRVREAWEAELAAGVPALRLGADPSEPLLLGSAGGARTLLVLPVGESGSQRPVAERLAATAGLRGESAVLVDLRGEEVPALPPGAPAVEEEEEHAAGTKLVARRREDGLSVWYPNGDRAPATLRRALEELESRFDRVFVVLPRLESPVTVSLLAPERPVVLAGRASRVLRTELAETTGLLARFGCAAAGVVLEAPRRGDRRG